MAQRSDSYPFPWLTDTDRGGPASDRAPPGPRRLTPAERRHEETTQVAREATLLATERRHAQVTKLRAARMAKEAEVPEVVPPPPKKASPRKRKA